MFSHHNSAAHQGFIPLHYIPQQPRFSKGSVSAPPPWINRSLHEFQPAPRYPPVHQHSQWDVPQYSIYNNVPLPSQSKTEQFVPETTIHPVLLNSAHFRFHVDFSLSVQMVKEPYPGCFAEPATCPTLPSVGIVIPAMPWPVVVHGKRRSCVTVGDVIFGIFQSLSLSDESVDMPLERASLRKQALGRTSKLNHHPECMEPVLSNRVKYLGGMHHLASLSKSSLGPDTFVLHLV
ncbi:hypothetical protein C8J56DRAFT_144321 [Mycena floridula]|nr:hypothetical protein C8J56DRAFT_144321 [Mycena floridula]